MEKDARVAQEEEQSHKRHFERRVFKHLRKIQVH